MKALALGCESVLTPIGVMLVLTDSQGRLCALDWEDYAPRMHRLLRLHYGEGGVALRDLRSGSAPCRMLQAYFGGDLAAIETIEVATGGTSFQRAVWAGLRAIPAGQTVSYGALAKRLDRPNASRAVGAANGANPVGIVVPCHRVIGADASLTGYGGGLHRKRWLLTHEGYDMAPSGSSSRNLYDSI